MSKIVCLAPVPAPIVSQWLVSQTGRIDIDVASVLGTSEDAIEQALADAEIVLGDYTFVRPIDEALLARAPRLKFVQQPSVGYQHIDLSACSARGVSVSNTPGVNDATVAEHTIMLALMLLRQAIYAHAKTAGGEWVQEELLWQRGVYELQGKHYGIIGMGRVGREVAKRLAGFGTKNLYFDPIRLERTDEQQLGVAYKPLEHLLKVSDVVSLHVPLTDSTRRMIGPEQLALMKFNAILINVARGDCIDERALAERLKQKKLAGAGLDVFSEEPIHRGNPLLGLDNVVLTPHLAGATAEVRVRIIELAIGNVARVLRGESPQYVLNPTA